MIEESLLPGDPGDMGDPSFPRGHGPHKVIGPSERDDSVGVVGHGKAMRIESRIPGADINPYLAYAAAIASGLDGIEKQIEPPPIFEGDVYSARNLPQVPRTLRDAIEAMEKSEFARQAFGDDVIDHYLHFFKTEQAAYDKAVTTWERARYFEQI